VDQYDEQEFDESDMAALGCHLTAQGEAKPKIMGQSFQGNTNRNYQNKARGGKQGYTNFQRGGPGNNFNRNGKFCYYCKQQNHRKQECKRKIRQIKLLWNPQGRACRS